EEEEEEEEEEKLEQIVDEVVESVKEKIMEKEEEESKMAEGAIEEKSECVDVEREQEQCKVCYDDLHNKRSVTFIPCMHSMHRTCAQMWMESRSMGDTLQCVCHYENTASQFCPSCRMAVEMIADDAGMEMEIIYAYGASGQPSREMITLAEESRSSGRLHHVFEELRMRTVQAFSLLDDHKGTAKMMGASEIFIEDIEMETAKLTTRLGLLDNVQTEWNQICHAEMRREAAAAEAAARAAEAAARAAADQAAADARVRQALADALPGPGGAADGAAALVAPTAAAADAMPAAPAAANAAAAALGAVADAAAVPAAPSEEDRARLAALVAAMVAPQAAQPAAEGQEEDAVEEASEESSEGDDGEGSEGAEIEAKEKNVVAVEAPGQEDIDLD
ncbi:hypothetical protein PFISCL1PPCAC_9514, partial [Pristionchus fissidentatus]